MKNDVSMSHDFLIITTVVVFFVLSAQNGAVHIGGDFYAKKFQHNFQIEQAVFYLFVL